MIATALHSLSACVSPCQPCDGCCTCELEPAAARRERQLRRWAWGLVLFTICWNTVEAVVALLSGLAANSAALIGFGLDSIVEVSSGLVMVWRFLQQSDDEEANERAERRAVRAIALVFFLMAAYITFKAVGQLLGVGGAPAPSPIGMALLAQCGKRRAGR